MAAKVRYVNVKVRPRSSVGPIAMVSFCDVGHSDRKGVLAQLQKMGLDVISTAKGNSYLMVTPRSTEASEVFLESVFGMIEQACATFNQKLKVRKVKRV